MSLSDNDDDLLDSLTERQHLLAGARALKRYGVDFEWRDDGSGIDVTDPDIVDLDRLMDSDEFVEYFTDELKKFAADNLLNGMVAKGILERDGVDGNGDIIYVLAEGVNVENFD